MNAPASFIAALLAPLPDSEEPADTPEYRKLIVRDMMMAWRAGMDHVDRAKAVHMQAAIDFRLGGADLSLEPFQARYRTEVAQCLIPAPTLKELRWKKRSLAGSSANPAPEVVAAIKADEARLVAEARS